MCVYLCGGGSDGKGGSDLFPQKKLSLCVGITKRQLG